MSKRFSFLVLLALLAVSAPVWLSGAAQAGPAPICGDGTITAPELCDDSNTVTGDGCSHPSCLPEVCGDDVINPDPPGEEECDGGNNTPGDGCDANCKLECGNGVEDPGEDCDESGETATCDDDCTDVSCGDSNTNEAAGEECDPPATGTCSPECLDIGEPPTKKEQGCINAVNKNLAGVVKAQTGDNSACFKSAAKGDPVATCYGTDLKGKVAKAQAKTSATFTGKKCVGTDPSLPPELAFTTPAAVNDAGEIQLIEGTSAVFGNPPVLVTSDADKPGAGCQAEAIKQYNAIANKWIQEANKAKKAAIKGGKGNPPTPPPVADPAALSAAIDAALSNNANVVKAETKASTGLSKKCTEAQVDGLFECGGAATVEALRLCIIAAAEGSACEAYELADGLTLTCLPIPAPAP